MTDPIFIPHITLDGIIAALSIIGGGAVFLMRVTGKLTRLDLKVEEHGIKIDKLVGIAEVQARHDERLIDLSRRVNLQDQRWEDMRHGKGLVVEESRAP